VLGPSSGHAEFLKELAPGSGHRVSLLINCYYGGTEGVLPPFTK
jgi:hypothetical protein